MSKAKTKELMGPVAREGVVVWEGLGEEQEEEEVHRRLWKRFVQTKEYGRFVEFCEECRASRYIGVCYGAAGVGKTESAKEYARWDEIEPLLSWHGVVQPRLSPENPRPTVALYTPTATVTARQIEKDIALLRWSLRVIGEAARAVPQEVETVEGMVRPGQVDLLVVDEADRLKPQAVEVLRDVYDRSPTGLVLIGMPGLEKRLARYPQLYSRVGFVHQYRTLGKEEQQELVEQQVRSFGGGRGEGRKIEKEAVAQIIRMTGGNFRQMERLLLQMKRIIEINPEVEQVNREVVEAAREQLVFGRGV
ncbi:ATP-binding protein [Ktedonosporobacter rubrisoli]|uniref:ATP-binding protein n=1 Tax=Ktedonosporobacter rubrisoli TaxID=2509675 RepID=A0A4P6JQC3_KTERU|nr:AAA family ATPase [Ktedonosporobacter rubrisoli]QBD74472.1 ATP-binding protein [Ktedonosporobacter rubrisoli]QBD77332.1 ATP-binding protein [Ktedonosporobacter rubrisoli]